MPECGKQHHVDCMAIVWLCSAALLRAFTLVSAEGKTVVQVVQENSTSAVFSIAMVVVYDECIISEVSLQPAAYESSYISAAAFAASGPTWPCKTCVLFRLYLNETSVIALGTPLHVTMLAEVTDVRHSACRLCPKLCRTTHSPPSFDSMVLTCSLLSMCL